MTVVGQLGCFTNGRASQISQLSLAWSMGLVGIVSTIPGLSDLAGLFGMGQIIWIRLAGDYHVAPEPDCVTCK